MYKKCLLILFVLASVCFCLFAESKNVIGIRFDYSLQKVDVKKTPSGAVRAFSDSGYGAGVFYNHSFDNNLVVGADAGVNFYSYEKSGFSRTLFTLDVLGKFGYRFELGNIGYSVVAITAGMDYRQYDSKKGCFPVAGLDALFSFDVAEKLSIGLDTQAQIVIQGIPKDTYGTEKNPVFNFSAVVSYAI